VTSWGSLVWGSQKRTILCVIGVRCYTVGEAKVMKPYLERKKKFSMFSSRRRSFHLLYMCLFFAFFVFLFFLMELIALKRSMLGVSSEIFLVIGVYYFFKKIKTKK
jgi:hypothetical protein